MTQLFGNMQTTCPVSCVLHTAFVHPVHHTAPNNLTKLNTFPENHHISIQKSMSVTTLKVKVDCFVNYV